MTRNQPTPDMHGFISERGIVCSLKSSVLLVFAIVSKGAGETGNIRTSALYDGFL